MNMGYFGERDKYITLQTLQNGAWVDWLVDCGADAYMMYLRSGDTNMRAVKPDGLGS